jgi:hypothetical protein
MKMGVVDDFSNFINAVIDEKSFKSISNYIDGARNSNDASILVGELATVQRAGMLSRQLSRRRLRTMLRFAKKSSALC